MYGGNDKICGIGFKIFYCSMGSRCGCSTAKSVSKIRFSIDNHWNDMEGFPGGSVVKNLPANAGVAGSIPVSGRSPGVGNGRSPGVATHSVFLPGESHGQRSLASYSPWGHKRAGCN